MIHKFNSSMAFSKFYLRQNYSFVGETVIDATVGNGHDTEWLLGEVGSSGHVIGFDIQATAIQRTQDRLNQHRNLTLILDGHQHLLKYSYDNLACVLYNLGYLPRGDKSIATTPQTTIQSIRAASQRIKVGGVIMVIAYPGHTQGKEEMDQLETHFASYDQNLFQCWKQGFINQRNHPPVLYCLEKRRAE